MSSVDGRLLTDRWTEPFNGKNKGELMGIDGSAGSTSIFHYIGKGNPSQGQSLELLSAQMMEDGVVWLRYKFHKNS